jgi:hypothetical protein
MRRHPIRAHPISIRCWPIPTVLHTWTPDASCDFSNIIVLKLHLTPAHPDLHIRPREPALALPHHAVDVAGWKTTMDGLLQASYPGDYEETLIRSFNHRRCLRSGSPAGCDRLRRGAPTGRACTVSCCSWLQRSVGPSATGVASNFACRVPPSRIRISTHPCRSRSVHYRTRVGKGGRCPSHRCPSAAPSRIH